MREAVREGHGVDEGLQRGAGRAHRQGHVDGAAPGRIQVAGAADLGEHPAVAVVEDEDRGREVRTGGGGALGRQDLQPLLQAPVDREADRGGTGIGRHRLLGGVRREHRERPARRRHRLGPGGVGLRRREDAPRDRHREDPVAGGAGALGEPVRTAGLGRLRQCDEQGRLRGGQPDRLAPEIRDARRPDALERAAIGASAR